MEIENLFSVKGKVVLVTGGSRGIGRMIAEGFVVNGARVYISARKKQECEQTVADLSKFGYCQFIIADLGSAEGVEKLAQEMEKREKNGLNILVNNAGTNWSQPFKDYSMEGFQKVIKLNLESVFFLTQKLSSLLRKASTETTPASVINIGSINGIIPPTFHTFAYSASKAALHMLTKHMAITLAPYVTVNAIAPGSFESKMMAETLENFGEVIKKGVPMGRIGRKEDMASVCIWLGSKGGSYVNGSVIVVDGGAVINQPHSSL